MVPSDEMICKSKRTKECFRVKRTISKITDSLIVINDHRTRHFFKISRIQY